MSNDADFEAQIAAAIAASLEEQKPTSTIEDQVVQSVLAESVTTAADQKQAEKDLDAALAKSKAEVAAADQKQLDDLVASLGAVTEEEMKFVMDSIVLGRQTALEKGLQQTNQRPDAKELESWDPSKLFIYYADEDKKKEAPMVAGWPGWCIVSGNGVRIAPISHVPMYGPWCFLVSLWLKNYKFFTSKGIIDPWDLACHLANNGIAPINGVMYERESIQKVADLFHITIIIHLLVKIDGQIVPSGAIPIVGAGCGIDVLTLTLNTITTHYVSGVEELATQSASKSK